MALMLESLCRIIVGIHEQSEDPQFGAREAKNRVRQEHATQALALGRPRDRQAAGTTG